MRLALKRLAVITLGVILLTAGWSILNSWHRNRRIDEEMREMSRTELPKYSAFLKLGMTRFAVQEELRSRSINFETARDLGHGFNDIVLLKKLPSPQWYCSYEAAGVRAVFHTDDDASPVRSTSEDDVLLGLDVYGQLMDCL